MSEEQDDNVIRVDFRQRQVLDTDEEVAPLPEPGQEAKHETFARLIDIGLVMVTLDTRVSGVDVPEAFGGVPQLHLNFSHRFRIPDFAYDEESVSATLSFETGEHHCVVPWEAIYVMVCEAADACHLYPGEFPAELQSVLPKLLAQFEGSVTIEEAAPAGEASSDPADDGASTPSGDEPPEGDS